MNIDEVKTHKIHFQKFKMNAIDKDVLESFNDYPPNIDVENNCSSEIKTVLDFDTRQILAIYGFAEFRPGVAFIFLYPCELKLFKQYTKEILCRSKKFLMYIIKKYPEIVRYETLVLTENKRAKRFTEWLGFHCEGVSRMFDHKERNYYIYSLIRTDKNFKKYLGR